MSPIQEDDVSETREAALAAVVLECSNMFHHYARLHLCKDPPDMEKAQRNIEMADKCDAVLAQAAPADEETK